MATLALLTQVFEAASDLFSEAAIFSLNVVIWLLPGDNPDQSAEEDEED